MKICRWLLLILLSLVFVRTASAQHTYYVSSGIGADSNTSTQAQNKTTPWAHAPGMTGCTSACASYVPVAGDQFIFRGGDTWTASGTSNWWTWAWAGSSGSHIKIGGLDQTWFAGSSWTRPIISGAGSFPNSSGAFFLEVSVGSNYVEVAALEWTGLFWNNNTGSAGYVRKDSTAFFFHDNYVHGWGHGIVGSDAGVGLKCATAADSLTQVYNNAFDGSDTTKNSFTSISDSIGACPVIYQNYFSYVANALVASNPISIHDNFFNFTGVADYDGITTNAVAQSTIDSSGLVYYNNVHVGDNNSAASGTGVSLAPQLSQRSYGFNNVFVNALLVGNEVMFTQASSSSGGAVAWFNNTEECGADSNPTQNCIRMGGGAGVPPASAALTNNHYITSGTVVFFDGVNSCNGTTTCVVTSTTPVTQTKTAANGQGYSAGQTFGFSPVSGSGATVGTGTNETSLCTTISGINSAAGTACQSDTTYAVSYSASSHTVSFPARTAIARPSSAVWDAGAYQFSAAPGVAFSPTSLAFGNQNVGSTSSGQTVTLTNSGTANTVLSSNVTLAGTNAADFAITASTCTNGTTIAPAANCTFTITFMPSATGARSANWTVSDNAAGSPHTGAITGTGTAPAVTFNPTSLAFGNQNVGTPSPTRTVTLTNSGTGPLTLSSTLSMAGTNAADFTLSSNTCTNTLVIIAGATCGFAISFTPSATGAESANWTVSDNASGSPHTGAVSGTGVTAPVVSFVPTGLSFGSSVVGTPTATQTVEMKNVGAANLVLSSNVTLAGANPTEFSLSGSGTCVNGLTVTPGNFCTIIASFDPLFFGFRSATWTVTDNASGSPHTGGLTGTGLAPVTPVAGPPALLNLSPASVLATSPDLTLTVLGQNFVSGATINWNGIPQTTTYISPGQLIATISAAKLATQGAAQVTVTQAGLTTNPLNFQILTPMVGIGSYSPTVFTPGSSVTVTVHGQAFNPTATVFFDWFALTTTFVDSGTLSAFVPGSDISGNGPHHVSVYNAAVPSGLPSLQIQVLLGFGNQPTTTTVTQTITITNISPSAVTFSTPFQAITGPNAADFAFVAGGTCANGGTLAPGANCTAMFSFTPSVQGNEQAVIAIQSNGNGSPQYVTLSGSGTAPAAAAASFSLTVLSFGNQQTGTASAPIVTNFTNSGNANLVVSALAIAGVNSADFALGGTCTSSTTLVPGQSCTLSVTFTPSTTSTESAQINITDNAVGSVRSVGLTGTGTTTAAHYVVLTWTASTSGNLIGYNVYRGVVSGGPYTLLTPSPVGGTSYTDAAVTHGTTYFYVFTSVGTSPPYSTVESVNSTQVSATP